MTLAESDVEHAAIEWFQAQGYTYRHGNQIAPGEPGSERADYRAVFLEGRLRSALAQLNPHLPASTLDDVARRVIRPPTASLEHNNAALHRMLTHGVSVEVQKSGGTQGDLALLVDFEDPARNDWLVVNQFTVKGPQETRRPDLVVFLNGMPIAVIELKNPADPNATLQSAWNQLQTYKLQIPDLFTSAAILIIGDGTKARAGSLTAPFERFTAWKSIDGSALAPAGSVPLHILIEGLFDRRRLLDYLRHFSYWLGDGGARINAAYHQYFAVNKAVEATVRAAHHTGDGRIGVVWHTQGSGKSISMVLYAGKIAIEPDLFNPTLVVLTDRNDLDGQLFATFANAAGLIEAPEQAESREDLRNRLRNRASGGIIFTTIQKFSLSEAERRSGQPFPVLSERRNVIVMTDEAHRSQYGFETRVDPATGRLTYGLAKNLRDALPRAAFIGFTGTPIELDDKSTPAVFGDYIDTYTISQAVDDGATVPIYYEARLARIDLPEAEKPRIDQAFEEVTEGEEEASREKLKTSWAKLEALVGTEKRIHLVARDILDHWDRRKEILAGKAMIVCMSRRICVDLYEEITRLRPDWHSDDDAAGRIKVVMTGGAASDPINFQPHIRNKQRQQAIEKRFKDPDDPLELVIVRDMWLTGFDVPCAHTLYVDKPMRGHTLMQAIARVNRVFRDKPSGLVVDYLGLAEFLRQAVGRYGGQQGERAGVPVEEALAVLREKHDVVAAMYHGFDYRGFVSGTPTERLQTLAGGANYILGTEDGERRYLDAMAALNKAAGMALHLEGARALRDDIGFFQAVQKNLQKYTVGGSGKSSEELDSAIRQILAGAVTSGEVIDVFAAAGLQKPDLSILSDEFLETVKASPFENLQVELLQKLINDEIRAQSRHNVIQARRFSEMLEQTLNRYRNRSLTSAQVILELIEVAKTMRDAPKRGAVLGLTDDELAFYDALADHGNVRDVMGDAVLSAIAHDLVAQIRRSVTIDWTQKEAVRARMRTQIKRLLRRHGYPPDKEEAAVITVLRQAEQVCADWAEAA